jgi:hypothetical protein
MSNTADIWTQGGGAGGPFNPLYGQQSTMVGQSQVSSQNAAQQIANTQANAAMYPAKLQQQRFQQLFPLLSGQLGSQGNPYTEGGSVALGPNISTAPVLNPQQIQQQVNTMRATNDQSTASQQRAMQQSLAGRGLGGNSPLAQALGSNMQNANLAANTAGETQTRLGAAQQNAQQVLNAQQAQQNQYATQQQLQVERAAPYFQRQNVLIQALAGLV